MKKKKNKSRTPQIIVLSLSCFLVIAFMIFSVYKDYREMKEKEKEEERLNMDLIALKEDEERLESEISRLQDPEYLARYAREKYFYSKEDELIIRIPTED